MRHLKKGRKFGRTSDQRKSLLRNLAFQLVLHERITTSEAKAKELVPLVEKMITTAKSGTITARRHLNARLPEAATKKLVSVLAPRMRDRKGGHLRIMKLSPRPSDGSHRAIIEFVQ